jgi:lipid II:glycine glycyltransferase (peptidoglycan interpeptide bridge formation enzyme)
MDCRDLRRRRSARQSERVGGPAGERVSGRGPAIREATAEDLRTWDAQNVDRPGGHVYQSRAWGEYQVTAGWRTRHLVFEDGYGVLALERRYPLLAGGTAYLSRGPVPTDHDEARTADRLRAATRWLANDGIDVVATDAEVPAAVGFGALIGRYGFRPIPEIQPSRHTMVLPLAERDEPEVFGAIAKSTRQRIRQAERSGAVVSQPTSALRPHLDRFYDLLRATGERRGFTFGARREFVTWWERAHAAGHLVYLVAAAADDPEAARPLAGLILFRHGHRLSTVHSADVSDARATHPGLPHLLRWRAIQLAIAEGRARMDLGGVDVAGARRIPKPGEPMYGLYEHKRSFGAEWVELAGAHERVIRPRRYRVGRVLTRLARALPGRDGSPA